MSRDIYRKKDIALSCLLVVMISLIINPASWTLAVIALLSLIVIVYPIIRFQRTKDMMHICIVPPIAMTWVYFLAPYLYSSLPVNPIRVMPKDFLTDMAWYSGISVIALFAGYYLSFRKSKVAPISSESFAISKKSIGTYALGLLGLAVLYRIIYYYLPGLLSPLGHLTVLLDFAPVLAVSMGLLFVLRGGKSLYTITPLVLLFVVEILLRISETLISSLIYMLVALILIYVFERRSIPYIVLFVMFLAVFPIYNERFLFRDEAVNRWYYQSDDEKAKIPELIGIGFDYLGKSYERFDYNNLYKGVKAQGETRFENVTYLGQCVYLVEQHGRELKYGETFWWLPATVIPRIIFPWKPENTHGTLLATEYGIRNPEGKSSFNFPILVEMYINFSFVGMVVFSFFQGILMKWCLSKASFGKGDFNLLLMVCLLWELARVESNITMVFGAIFHSLIIWWIVAKIIGRLSSGMMPAAECSDART